MRSLGRDATFRRRECEADTRDGNNFEAAERAAADVADRVKMFSMVVSSTIMNLKSLWLELLYLVGKTCQATDNNPSAGSLRGQRCGGIRWYLVP
mmetsp:Transcript_6770/g.11035  ORF Transcript_6770/g.11035 Transcript_6770/m.11035 type:complete len:95 (-) Transcript_6770:22-306(-)